MTGLFFRILFQQGGGWCYDLNDCAFRAGTPLGSSNNYSATIGDDEATGLFDDDPAINPFYQYNRVYFQVSLVIVFGVSLFSPLSIFLSIAMVRH
jgi:hypothetical protein